MNNPMGATNSLCCNNDNLICILILLMFLCPGMLGNCGNDSFIIILFILMCMPNFFNRGIC